MSRSPTVWVGAMLTPYEEELEVGTRFAERFQIQGVVGRGSMGIVYQARHELMGRVVAIKMLRGQLASDERSMRRFEREARAASRMDHPNLIAVHDFGLTDNRQPYLVMDFAQGCTLYEVQRREDHLTPVRAVRIFTQVCDALQHAHLQGVIHRDLKPSNIMLIEKDGEPDFVKVFDLGIAKIAWGEEEDKEPLTRTNEVCGSPIYLSPEQCKHEPLDARSDIYSLGVVMYELLTGVPPLMGETVYDTIYMHVHEHARSFSEVRPDLHIPSRMERIVFKALEKEPDVRYQSMQELKWELQASLQASDPHLQVLPPEALINRRKRSAGETPPMPQQAYGSDRPRANPITPAASLPPVSPMTPARTMPAGSMTRAVASVAPQAGMTPASSMPPLPSLPPAVTGPTPVRSTSSGPPASLFEDEDESPKAGLSPAHAALISSVASILITLSGVGLYLANKSAPTPETNNPPVAQQPVQAPEQENLSQPNVAQLPPAEPQPQPGQTESPQITPPEAQTQPPQQPVVAAPAVVQPDPAPAHAAANGHGHKVAVVKHPPQAAPKQPPKHGKQTIAAQPAEQKPATGQQGNPFFSIFQGWSGQPQKQPTEQKPAPTAARKPAPYGQQPVTPQQAYAQPYGRPPQSYGQPPQQQYPPGQHAQQTIASAPMPQQQYQGQPPQHHPQQEVTTEPPIEAIEAYNAGVNMIKTDPEHAIQKFQQALAIYPVYRRARTNLGRARANYGNILLDHDKQRAMQNYREALDIFAANGDTQDYQKLRPYYDDLMQH